MALRIEQSIPLNLSRRPQSRCRGHPPQQTRPRFVAGPSAARSRNTQSGDWPLGSKSGAGYPRSRNSRLRFAGPKRKGWKTEKSYPLSSAHLHGSPFISGGGSHSSSSFEEASKEPPKEASPPPPPAMPKARPGGEQKEKEARAVEERVSAKQAKEAKAKECRPFIPPGEPAPPSIRGKLTPGGSYIPFMNEDDPRRCDAGEQLRRGFLSVTRLGRDLGASMRWLKFR